MKFKLTGIAAITLLLTGCHFNAALDVPDEDRDYSESSYLDVDSQKNNESAVLSRDTA